MAYDDSQYTRDWDLLKGVKAEWEKLVDRFDALKDPTVPGDRIEAFWDEIFRAEAADSPCIRRVAYEIPRDESLTRHLQVCFYRRLEEIKRRGYKFREVHGEVVKRVLWIVCRNAHRWLRKKDSTHWAFYRNTNNLTKELERTLDYMEKNEGTRGVQPPVDTDGKEREGSCDHDRDYKGDHHDPPEFVVEAKENALRYCWCSERKLIADWLDNFYQEEPDPEEEVLARHPEYTKEDLDRILRRIAGRMRDERNGMGA
jgi:hypothetical protein